MADDNRISLPSGMGGLMRYNDEFDSKLKLKPGSVIVIAVILIILILALHVWGDSIFGI